MTGHRAARRVGTVLAALYIAVVGLTAALVPHNVRPLFDGFTPPAPYQWVEPPPELAHTNKPPDSVSVDLALQADPNVQLRSATTPDGQVLVNFSETALVGRPSDITATISLTPLAPSTLGDTPPGKAANGNAYRVQIRFAPSGARQTKLDGLTYILLRAPEQPEGLLHSPDGERWEEVEGAVSLTGALLVRAELKEAGWFVAYGDPVTSDDATSDRPPFFVLIIGLAALAALAFSAVRITDSRDRDTKAKGQSKKRRR